MFENGENISQSIFCRLFIVLFEKRYHSEFSGINHSTVYHKQRKEKKFNYDPYSYPIYRIYHYPIYLGVADRKFPMWENARARIVTDKETEDFHSELPNRIAVLLAFRLLTQQQEKRKLQYVFRQPGG